MRKTHSCLCLLFALLMVYAGCTRETDELMVKNDGRWLVKWSAYVDHDNTMYESYSFDSTFVVEFRKDGELRVYNQEGERQRGHDFTWTYFEEDQEMYIRQYPSVAGGFDNKMTFTFTESKRNRQLWEYELNGFIMYVGSYDEKGTWELSRQDD